MNVGENTDGSVLLVDKPLHWTSFDVVKKIRKTLQIKKVGHAGTLDPLATGLLIICTGPMTKKIETFQSMDKEYEGMMIIGKTTPSHDLETDVTETRDWKHLKESEIINSTENFIGKIRQVPPAHSAVRVDGSRAYKMARAGEKVELKPREIYIKQFEITKLNLPEIAFKVICSKGTYIRGLVRDFGESLNTGAYLAELCRTRIGSYSLEDAKTITEVCTINENI